MQKVKKPALQMKGPSCREQVQNNRFIIIDKYLINGIRIV
jgi:hypothetical protein